MIIHCIPIKMLNNLEYDNPYYLIENMASILHLAEQKNSLAQAYLGICYSSGWGVEKDQNKAMVLFKESSFQGHPLGHAKLGLAYASSDPEKEKMLYRCAAEQDYPLGQAYLATLLEEENQESFPLYKKSAEGGCPIGQIYLGSCYEDGYGTDKDKTKALELYKNSADRGSPYGKACLALLYIDNDFEQASELLIESYEYRSKAFEELSPHLHKLSSTQLNKVLCIARSYKIESDIAKILSFAKSHSYIKVAKWLLSSDCCCSVCLENITPEDAYVTKCLHTYHEGCVSKADKCPLCRQELEEINC